MENLHHINSSEISRATGQGMANRITAAAEEAHLWVVLGKARDKAPPRLGIK